MRVWCAFSIPAKARSIFHIGSDQSGSRLHSRRNGGLPNRDCERLFFRIGLCDVLVELDDQLIECVKELAVDDR